MKKILLIPKYAILEKEIISQISELPAGRVSRSIDETKAGWIFVSSDKNDETEARSSSDWVIYTEVIPDKKESIILDYAGNIEKHMPDGDLYKPEVKAKFKGGSSELIEVICETCLKKNEFIARKNDEGYLIDKNGYFLDLEGNRVMVECGEELKPMPAHWGRRCNHYDLRTGERCTGRWSFKTCPVCEAENDIAARYCSVCRAELVNPNEKLIDLHTKHKKDPTQWQTDEVLDMTFTPSISKAGNQMLVVDVMLSRRQVKFYLMENNNWQARQKAFWASFTNNFTKPPRTITYRKKDDFWEVNNFNALTDEEILNAKLNTHRAS